MKKYLLFLLGVIFISFSVQAEVGEYSTASGYVLSWNKKTVALVSKGNTIRVPRKAFGKARLQKGQYVSSLTYKISDLPGLKNLADKKPRSNGRALASKAALPESDINLQFAARNALCAFDAAEGGGSTARPPDLFARCTLKGQKTNYGYMMQKTRVAGVRVRFWDTAVTGSVERVVRVPVGQVVTLGKVPTSRGFVQENDSRLTWIFNYLKTQAFSFKTGSVQITGHFFSPDTMLYSRQTYNACKPDTTTSCVPYAPAELKKREAGTVTKKL